MPLLNEYKRDFVLRRIPQTLLGGVKLHLGYTAPFYVYLNQIILFILPFILGGILTLITELAKLRFDIVCYIYGVLMFVFVLLVQIISFVRTRRKPTVGPKTELKHNILSEDDEIEFESCFGKETVEFVSPVKPLLLIPLHAVISGITSGLGLWFLLPSVLYTLFTSPVVTVVISVFGWLTMCIGLYPLTVTSPPELSQYRALVTWDVVPGRPVHMLVCFILHAVMSSVPVDVSTTVSQTCHAVFCTLPVLWLTGVLPCTEVLVLWMLEQIHVHVLGGSYMANPVRTMVMTSLSCLTLLTYLARDSTFTVLIILTVLNFLLSLDLCGLFSKILQTALKTRKNDTKRREIVWILVKVLFYTLMLGSACTVTALTIIYNTDISRVYIAGSIIGVLCLDYVLRNVQKVYWFGLVRNPVFPRDVNRERNFKRRKFGLYVVGVGRRIVINFVSPLLMLLYVVSHFSSTTSITDFWFCITVTRAIRHIFQSTSLSLLDLSIHSLLTITTSTNSATWWSNLTPGTQLIIISATRDRTLELISKLYTLFIILLETIKDRKKFKTFRGEVFLKCGLPVLVVPVYLVIVLLPAVVLSAPLLPVFTLPFFWLSAPRPRHFWSPQLGWRREEVSGEEEVRGDAVFYQQAVPELVKMVNRAISGGALDSYPGAQYLLRYQDRLVWISVLERGFSYTTLQIRGLELQETSCHTIEAARIDDLFQLAFENDKICGFNRYCLNTLTPKDTDFISTYSDAKNVLTGIIDNPENLKKVFEDLEKAIGWVILNHLLNPKRVQKSGKFVEDDKVNVGMLPVPKVSGSKLPPLNHSIEANSNGKASGQPLQLISSKTKLEPIKLPKPRTPENIKQSKLKSKSIDDCDLEDLLDDWDSPRNSPVLVKPKQQSRSQTKVSLVTGRPVSPAHSEAESMWSVETTDFVPLKTVNSKKSKLLPAFSNRMDDFKTEDEDTFSPPNFLSNDNSRFGIHKAGANLLSDVILNNPLSKLYEPPAKWLSVPLEKDSLEPLVQKLNSPNLWYKLVIERLILSHDLSQNVRSLANDETFCKLISYLVALGRWVFYEEMNSDRASSSGSSYVYKSYLGQIYNSSAEYWLSQNQDLKQLFTLSYRYSVKLMIDQAVLGSLDDLDEFADSFSEYDQMWYIGQESDAEWCENINSGMLNLLSISHSAYNNLYTSRTLSRISLPVSLGSLNDELVRAQWANLSLELLYMTNDDEERDSIQAQANILRNLTVQAADPPLGYPLYTSGLISLQNL